MRFFRYALGEIALVVVGILIALQINNWNEERIEQRQIREFALNLADAIQRDLAMLDPVEMQMRASMRSAQLYAEYVRDREMADFTNAEMYFLTDLNGFRPYGWNRAALEQLKASGGLRQMRNRELGKLISDYDALTRHLDQDFMGDDESARAMKNLREQLVDQNYPPELLGLMPRWDDGFSEDDIERDLVRFRNGEAYRSMAALDLPLLSQDLVAYRHLANLALRYADNLEARPEIELPRLRGMANEILTLIDAEYR